MQADLFLISTIRAQASVDGRLPAWACAAEGVRLNPPANTEIAAATNIRCFKSVSPEQFHARTIYIALPTFIDRWGTGG